MTIKRLVVAKASTDMAARAAGILFSEVNILRDHTWINEDPCMVSDEIGLEYWK